MTRTVSVGELGHGGASKAIRDAEQEPVLVSRQNRPAAWILSTERLAQVAAARGESPDAYESALRLIAVDMYRQEVLSLGQAARLAGMWLGDFIDLCGRLRIPVLWEPRGDITAEVDRLDATTFVPANG